MSCIKPGFPVRRLLDAILSVFKGGVEAAHSYATPVVDGMNGRKGFVITIDAIAALSFMLLSLYFIQSTSFNPQTLKGTQLKEISLDTFSVLEKSGRLEAVVAENSTAAREILLATPEAVCMQLSVAAPNGTVIATIDKPACGGIGSEVQVTYGVFRSGADLYSGTLRSWFEQEAEG